MNRVSFNAHPATNAFLRWSASRRVVILSIVSVGGFGLWLLFLAVIGFHYGMVPSDALNRMAGRPQIIRWLDEAVFGIPVEHFYSWCSLISGLAICAIATYSALHLPPSTHDSKTRDA